MSLLLTQKFHPFGLWHIPLFPFPALKRKIIKNAFLHLHKLLILEMKIIYKISLMFVLWKQVVQMTDFLLRWKNKISALAYGYGDVQMEEPVPGKHHKPLPRERGEISLLPSWQYTARHPCPAEWWVVQWLSFQVRVPDTSFFPIQMEHRPWALTAKPMIFIFWFWSRSQCITSVCKLV